MPADEQEKPGAGGGGGEGDHESERMARLKAERLRRLEQEHDQAQEAQEELRARRKDHFVPYGVETGRKEVTAEEVAAEQRASREAEREAGLEGVAIGPPAADTDRDGKPGGKRGVPVAVLALIPVLLILGLPILFGQVYDLKSREPGAYGPDGTLFIAAAPGENGGLKATLTWAAPPLAPLKISGAKRDGAFANSATVTADATMPGSETTPKRVSVAPLLGTGPAVNVVLVPTTPDTALLVGGATSAAGGKYVLRVGQSGARIAFTNDARGDTPLRLRIVSRPDPKNFALGEGEDGGEKLDAFSATPGQAYVLPVSAVLGGKPEDRLLIVSSDARQPLITIDLRRVDGEAAEEMINKLIKGDVDGALAAAKDPKRDAKDAGALAVKAYVLKSRQQPGTADPDADRALEAAVRALEQNEDAPTRVRALVRRAMAREAELQNKPDRAVQFRSEAEALDADVARLP